MAGIVGVSRVRRLGKDLRETTALSATLRAAALACSALAPAGLTAGLMAVPQLAQAQSYVFNTVEIEGNQRVERGTILSYAALPRGRSIDAAELNEAVQRVRDSGLFEQVDIRIAGSQLTFIVVEYPTVSAVAFEGNRRLEDSDLAALVRSQSRRIFSPSQAEADAQTIAEAYAMQGRLAARVTPKVIRRPDNRVDLVFEISEGATIEVERIGFVGNRAYTDRRLRRVLESRQAGFLRAIVGGDTFVEDRLPFDRQLLADFYASRGYVDFEVTGVSAELSEERDAFFLSFTVVEGQVFTIGEISVDSQIDNLDPLEFSEALKLKSGKTYSPVLIDNEVTRLERLAVFQGRDFVDVVPRITRNDRDLTLDVTFELKPRERIFVERIDIEGNTTTMDHVIRREFDFVEGDPFNPRAVSNAADRIRRLGFFEDANVQTREGSSPRQVIVDVDVEERPTGSLSFGGSYSVDDGFGLLISFSERNLLGRGQILSLSANSASTAKDYSFSFTEPSLFAQDLSFSLDAKYAETDGRGANYDTLNALLQPSLNFPLTDFARFTLRTGFKRSDISIPSGSISDVGDVVTAEAAEEARDSLFVGFTYDWDSGRVALDPINRYRFSLGSDLGGVTGENQYLRSTATAVAQTKILSEEVTLRATLEAGVLSYLSGSARSSDRFVIGSSKLRGFSYGGIGPREVGNDVDDPLGGKYFAVLRLEGEFPLGLPEEYGLSGGVFYDIGSVWGLDDSVTDRVSTAGQRIVSQDFEARHAVGFALLWDSAIGPLQMNFSQTLAQNRYDDDQSFNLSLQTQF